jgi:hypothetical protein
MAAEPEVLIHAEPQVTHVAEHALSTREEARSLADWTMAAQSEEQVDADFNANFTHLQAIPDLGAPEPSDHDFIETAESEPLKVEETHWHRPGAVKDESPLFPGHDEFTANDDLDRKIDEALELAERMRAPKKSFEGDDLDVPAFLRSGAKDIPLD